MDWVTASVPLTVNWWWLWWQCCVLFKGKLKEMHQQFVDETQLDFTKVLIINSFIKLCYVNDHVNDHVLVGDVQQLCARACSRSLHSKNSEKSLNLYSLHYIVIRVAELGRGAGGAAILNQILAQPTTLLSTKSSNMFGSAFDWSLLIVLQLLLPEWGIRCLSVLSIK